MDGQRNGGRMTERPWKKVAKRPMLEIALDYAKRGWFVFPAPRGEKMSCVSGKNTNGNRWGATTTPKEIKDYFEQFPNANIGIATGIASKIWVSEADTLEGHNVDGVGNLKQLEAIHGPLPDTLIGESPSGSLHYFWQLPADKVIYNSTSVVAAGIDVLGEGGMVLAPPSVRPGKGSYKWLNAFEPALAPDWLIALVSPAKNSVSYQPSGEPEADPAEIAAALAVIPNDAVLTDAPNKPPGVSQRDYNRIGMAVWAATGGSEEGFQAFDQWARKSEKYHGGTRERWRHYPKSPPTKIGAGTIFYLAYEADPNWRDNYMPEQITLGAEITQGILPTSPVQLPETANLDLTPHEIPEHLLNPPGLVGEIAQWITDTAIYPQPGLSLGAALTVVGTAAGRHIGGPTHSGTHLYIVGIARTGAGKNHPLIQIGTLLSASGMNAHVGPSQFISMPSVINFIKREPLSVCAMDEFGAFLKRVNNKRASGFEGAVSSILRQAWGCSFTPMNTPEWAQTPSQKIESPAMSIYGVSTVKEFYDSLEGADVVNGILNRFLIIETSKRPDQRAPLKPANKVPPIFSQKINQIYARLGGAMNKQSIVKPEPIYLDISPEAEKIRMDFVNKLNRQGDKNEDMEALFARTAEIAIRLATIVTIGQDVDCIEADVMTWARDFAEWSGQKLASSAGLYIADSETQAMANEVKRTIKRLANGHKQVKHSAIIQALKYKYKSRDLKDVMDQMVFGGTLHYEKKAHEGGGPPTISYTLSGN